MATISLTDHVSLGGFRDRPNEDRAGMARNHAWVIDGATGLGEPFMGGPSDAAWLAQTASDAFARHSALSDPSALCEAAATDIAERFAAERTRTMREPWELPCGAFIMASVTDTGLRLTWCGDCRAIVQVDGGLALAFGATAMSEEEEAALVLQLAGAGGDPAQRYREPAALQALRAARGAALASDNALILCPDPSFVSRLHRADVEGRVFDVLLMSDGFAAAELRYGLVAGSAALLAQARAEGLAGLACRVRDFENLTDPDGVLKPRWKRSDDATAMLLKISSETSD